MIVEADVGEGVSIRRKLFVRTAKPQDVAPKPRGKTPTGDPGHHFLLSLVALDAVPDAHRSFVFGEPIRLFRPRESKEYPEEVALELVPEVYDLADLTRVLIKGWGAAVRISSTRAPPRSADGIQRDLRHV